MIFSWIIIYTTFNCTNAKIKMSMSEKEKDNGIDFKCTYDLWSHT